MRLAAFVFLFAGLIPWAGQAATFEEGLHYETLAETQARSGTAQLEVVEFFSYACPHCHHLEPQLQKWLAAKPDDVRLVRVPVSFGRPAWVALGKVWYTLEAMGLAEQHHAALFEVIHGPREQRPNNIDAVADFLAERGVDRRAFVDTYQSFAVDMKARRAQDLVERFAINAVPSLVINGKYKTSVSMAGGGDEVFELTDELLAAERKLAQSE